MVELFVGWENNPIVTQIPDKLKPYAYPPHFFGVPVNAPHYHQLSEFMLRTLEGLPLNNEVGETFLLRPDTTTVLRDLISLLRSEKSWKDIGWMFEGFDLELYKNKVYPSHNIRSAICYSIDLGTSYDLPRDNSVCIERIHVRNTDGKIAVNYDGRFTLTPKGIQVEADYLATNVIHTEDGGRFLQI